MNAAQKAWETRRARKAAAAMLETCDKCGEQYADESPIANGQMINVCPGCREIDRIEADPITEIFGEPISVYTRAQAFEDGVLVDMTEWASSDKGFIGGFTIPVAMTSDLWAKVQAPKGSHQDTRGRAHDVLFMASLAARRAQNTDRVDYRVILGGRYVRVRMVIDGDGITLGLPEDF